jgi:predicted NAD/FAD-dependent oxidoreductase
VAFLGADGVLSATVAAEPSYTSPQGASAIAKCLAVGLEILVNWQVQAIVAETGNWQIAGMTASGKALAVAAKAVVVTTPAPQAQAILAKQTLPAEFLAALDAVEFHPCFSVMAGYKVTALNLPSWQTCEISYGNLAWVGLDSSKRPQSEISVFVLQSTAEFAQKHLETPDLDSVARMLLAEATQLLPWLATPDWFEIHRWRYAFPSRPLNQDCLSTTDPLPLVCAGDWCGDRLVESALQSGIAAAEAINRQLEKRSLLGADFFAHL